MSTRLVPPGVREMPALTGLRLEVRAFLAEQIDAGVFVPHVDTWLTRWNREFTRELGRRGWLGMVIPTEYGGQGRTYVERFVVTEELLVVGAPVAAHWVAERQIGPSLLRYGTEEQKHAFLPGISRGEIDFGIGMSEPDSGSDLASVRTRAEQVDGGWRLTGTKVWTSRRPSRRTRSSRSPGRRRSTRPTGTRASASSSSTCGRPASRSARSSRWAASTTSTRCTSTGCSSPTTGCSARSATGWTQVTSRARLRAQRPGAGALDLPLLAAAAQAMADGRLPSDPGSAGTSRASRRCTRCRSPSSTALEAHEDADTAAAVVKELGTTREGDIADYVDTLTARGCGARRRARHAAARGDPPAARASPSGAARTRSCAGSSREGWGFADGRPPRPARPRHPDERRPRPRGHADRALRRLPRHPRDAEPRSSTSTAACGSG